MLHCPTGGIWRVPDGLQIGKSNENTTVFIDFQRIQVGPVGRPRILRPRSGEGNIFVAGGRKLTNYSLAD